MPSDWVAISNEASVEDAHQTSELAESVSQAASLFPEHAHLKIEGAKSFVFPESFKISTYFVKSKKKTSPTKKRGVIQTATIINTKN